MPKKPTYAELVQKEKLPVAYGRQFRAEEVKRIEDGCPGCAASNRGVIDKPLCNALPACTKEKRLDGLNVRYVDCGKAVAK